MPVRAVKRRYIAFSVQDESRSSGDQILNMVRNYLSHRIGYEQRDSNLRLLEFDYETGLGIVRCSHRLLGPVKECLSAQNGEVRLQVIGVSGTIRALRRKFLPPADR